MTDAHPEIARLNKTLAEVERALRRCADPDQRQELESVRLDLRRCIQQWRGLQAARTVEAGVTPRRRRGSGDFVGAFDLDDDGDWF